MSTDTSSSILSTRKPSKKEIEKQEAIAELREMLPVGATVYTVLRHVSKSGMSRDISLHIVTQDSIRTITYLAALALGDKVKEVGGVSAIRVNGCGMDMGWNLVYCLSNALYPNGFKPKDAGRSCGRNGTSADATDTDGGYALNQHWM